MRRKLPKAFIIAFLSVFVFAACTMGQNSDTQYIPVESLDLDITSVTLYINPVASGFESQAALTALITPANASVSVIWGSGNINIVKVEQGGIITAVGPGTAIVAVGTDRGGLTAVCEVTVVDMGG